MKQKEPTTEQINATKKALQLREIAKNDDVLIDWLDITKPTLYKRLKDHLWGKALILLIDNIAEHANHKLKSDLPQPISNITEILYELIHRSHIDRELILIKNHIRNLPAYISDLRNNPALRHNIQSNEYTGLNKYGSSIKFVNYSLINKEEAIEVYLEMVKNG